MTAPRCRPGDLAVVVNAQVTPELLHRFVIVEREMVDGEEVLPGVHVLPGGPLTWWCRSATEGALLPWNLVSNDDQARVASLDVIRRPICDQYLRPIRPEDGEDESLAWAAPRGVTVPSAPELAEAAP